MKRCSRALLIAALAGCAGGLTTGCAEPGEGGAARPGEAADTPREFRPPNIVLILADDMGMGDTSIYGSESIQTPVIDALANSGVRFTQGYVSHPVCSPSRAGLLTGRYQQRHGWEFNAAGRDVETGMSLEVDTIADMLRAGGYATGMIGKWHLGYGAPYHPLSRGFDEYFGVLAGGSLFIDPTTPGVESVGRLPARRDARIAVYRDRETVEESAYLTDAFTREAVRFIERHRDEPFFLYLSHTTPHTPLQATPEYLDRYRHVEDKAARIYAAMVASLDDSVARVLETLERTGNRSNTLIVFSSDNGCAGYLRGACSNSPFAGFKRYHQEGGIRVPLIMAWADGLPAGEVFEHPVSLLDLYSTFAAAAGTQDTTEDSVDLLPHLTGERTDPPHRYLYWRSGPTMAIRDDRWKLIRYNHTALTTADLGADGRLAPPPQGWPTDSPLGQLTLLYDLQADPGETQNLAAEHPEIVARLAGAHARWAEDLSASLQPAIRSTLADMHGDTVQLIF